MSTNATPVRTPAKGREAGELTNAPRQFEPTPPRSSAQPLGSSANNKSRPEQHQGDDECKHHVSRRPHTAAGGHRRQQQQHNTAVPICYSTKPQHLWLQSMLGKSKRDAAAITTKTHLTANNESTGGDREEDHDQAREATERQRRGTSSSSASDIQERLLQLVVEDDAVSAAVVASAVVATATVIRRGHSNSPPRRTGRGQYIRPSSSPSAARPQQYDGVPQDDAEEEGKRDSTTKKVLPPRPPHHYNQQNQSKSRSDIVPVLKRQPSKGTFVPDEEEEDGEEAEHDKAAVNAASTSDIVPLARRSSRSNFDLTEEEVEEEEDPSGVQKTATSTEDGMNSNIAMRASESDVVPLARKASRSSFEPSSVVEEDVEDNDGELKISSKHDEEKNDSKSRSDIVPVLKRQPSKGTFVPDEEEEADDMAAVNAANTSDIVPLARRSSRSNFDPTEEEEHNSEEGLRDKELSVSPGSLSPGNSPMAACLRPTLSSTLDPITHEVRKANSTAGTGLPPTGKRKKDSRATHFVEEKEMPSTTNQSAVNFSREEAQRKKSEPFSASPHITIESTTDNDNTADKPEETDENRGDPSRKKTMAPNELKVNTSEGDDPVTPKEKVKRVFAKRGDAFLDVVRKAAMVMRGDDDITKSLTREKSSVVSRNTQAPFNSGETLFDVDEPSDPKCIATFVMRTGMENKRGTIHSSALSTESGSNSRRTSSAAVLGASEQYPSGVMAKSGSGNNLLNFVGNPTISLDVGAGISTPPDATTPHGSFPQSNGDSLYPTFFNNMTLKFTLELDDSDPTGGAGLRGVSNISAFDKSKWFDGAVVFDVASSSMILARVLESPSSAASGASNFHNGPLTAVETVSFDNIINIRVVDNKTNMDVSLSTFEQSSSAEIQQQQSTQWLMDASSSSQSVGSRQGNEELTTTNIYFTRSSAGVALNGSSTMGTSGTSGMEASVASTLRIESILSLRAGSSSMRDFMNSFSFFLMNAASSRHQRAQQNLQSLLSPSSRALAGLKTNGIELQHRVKQLTIVHFNDVYNLDPQTVGPRNIIGGAARFQTVLKQLREETNPLVLFSGDYMGPSLMSVEMKGKQQIDVFNMLNVHYGCFGNHEFDYGKRALIDAVHGYTHAAHVHTGSNTTWVMTNMLDEDKATPLCGAQERALFTWNGVRVGIVGLCENWLPGCAQLSADSAHYLDMFERGETVARELKEAGAEIVIALTHCRVPNDKLIMQKCLSIDLLLGGHDHFYKCVPNLRMVKSGEEYQFLTEIKVEIRTPPTSSGSLSTSTQSREPVNKDTMMSSSSNTVSSTGNGGPITSNRDNMTIGIIGHPITKVVEKDPSMMRLIQRYNDKLDDRMGGVIGTTPVPLDPTEPAVRFKEGVLTGFVCDVMVSELGRMGVDFSVLGGAAFSGKSVIAPGPITAGHIFSMFPNDTRIMVVRIPGSTVLKMLNVMVRDCPNEAPSFPHCSSALHFTINVLHDPSEVEDVRINGEPIDVNKLYTVAVEDFAGKGSGKYKFIPQEGETIVDEESAEQLVFWVINYFMEKKGQSQAGKQVMNNPHQKTEKKKKEKKAKITSEERRNSGVIRASMLQTKYADDLTSAVKCVFPVKNFKALQFASSLDSETLARVYAGTSLLTEDVAADSNINVIMKVVLKLLRCEHCRVYLYDRTAETLRLASFASPDIISKIPVNENQVISVAAHAVLLRSVINIRDATSPNQSLFNPMVDNSDPLVRVRSMLCFPVILHKNVLAVVQAINKMEGDDTLLLDSSSDEESDQSSCSDMEGSRLDETKYFHPTFNDTDVGLALLTAKNIGIQLHFSEIFERMTRSERATTHLMDMATLLGTAKKDDSVAKMVLRIVNLATGLLNCDRASLFLVEKGEMWTVVPSADLTTEVTIRLPLGSGVVGHVAQTGEKFTVHDAYQCELFNREFDKRTGYHTKTILAIPMLSQNRDSILGVLQLINKKDGTVFNAQDEELALNFVNLASIAVHNSFEIETLRLGKDVSSMQVLPVHDLNRISVKGGWFTVYRELSRIISPEFKAQLKASWDALKLEERKQKKKSVHSNAAMIKDAMQDFNEIDEKEHHDSSNSPPPWKFASSSRNRQQAAAASASPGQLAPTEQTQDISMMSITDLLHCDI